MLLSRAEAAGSIGTWEQDLSTKELRWSEGLYRIMGVPEGEPITVERSLSFVDEEQRDFIERRLKEGLAEAQKHPGAPFVFPEREVTIRRPSGEQRTLRTTAQFLLDARGRPAKVVGVVIDITDMKSSSALAESVLEAAPDALIVVDELGSMTLVSSEAERMFGYRRSELLGQPVEMLLPVRFRSRHLVHRSHFMADPRRRPMGVGLDLYALRKDGSEFPVEIALSPIPTDKGMNVAAAIRDISARKVDESERARSKDQMRELDRLKEVDRFKTQFINTAAHELNTPLTPIKIQLHILSTLESEGLTEEQRKAVTVLSRNVDRLAQLVQDVLEVARLQSGRLVIRAKPSSLDQILEEAVESFRAAAEKVGVGLKLSGDRGLNVIVDAHRSHQILLNLISNAIKFTPRGGHITVDRSTQDDQAVIRVKDTGIGMTRDQVSKLFHPFTQVHQTDQQTYSGTGLGLFISKGIVEQMGGRISCDSAGPGKGSTFSFTLPLAVAPTPMIEVPAGRRTPAKPADEIGRRIRELI